jgi:hypothetical protein
MSPAQIASRINSNSVRAGLREFKRRCQYVEQHDPVMQKLNRLMKTTQHQEAA